MKEQMAIAKDNRLRSRSWNRLPLGCVLLVAGACLALFVLARCTPTNSLAQPQGAMAAPQAAGTPRPTATPSPIIVPTIDAALIARITSSWVELTEAQAKQAAIAAQASELDYKLTASAATLTASVPTVTQQAQLLVYAQRTQVQMTAVIETQAAARVAEIDHATAQRRVGTFWTVIIITFSAVCFLLILVVFNRWKVGRLEVMQLENEIESRRQELALPARVMPQVTIYHGEPGAVDRATYTDLPCTEAEMTTIAFWVVAREDRSLAINKYEGRGMSGRIKETRTWFVEQEYADQDENNVVTVNDGGVEFLTAWRASHITPALPVALSHSGNGRE
jgi:hypothetical protein